MVAESEKPRDSGPVVIGERSLASLLAIRHEWLLREMFGRVVICRTVADALSEIIGEVPDWLQVCEDLPDGMVELPSRLESVRGSDRKTLEIAVHHRARLVLLEGKGLLEKVKLSFIKSMGVIPLLIQAYQEGRIQRVKPLLTALDRKGHEMPPPEQMEALLRALDELA